MLVTTIETGIEAASAISKSFHLYYVPFTRFFFLDCKEPMVPQKHLNRFFESMQ
jgi:hypothetical protein